MPLGNYHPKNTFDLVPGPGSYEMSKTINTGQKFSIPRSQSNLTLSKNSKHETPGVGSYSSNTGEVNLKKNGFLFQKSQRHNVKEESQIGVGEYNIEYKTNNFAGFTISHSPSGRQ